MRRIAEGLERGLFHCVGTTRRSLVGNHLPRNRPQLTPEVSRGLSPIAGQHSSHFRLINRVHENNSSPARIPEASPDF